MKTKGLKQSKKEIVGILGYGEIGKTIAKICQEAGFKILIRELTFDQFKNQKVDYLHINIPEITNYQFIKSAIVSINEVSPTLTIINSSVTPGTTRKIFEVTKQPIVHSPVIGIHPNLYASIKYYFPKIIGSVDKKSLLLAKKHFKDLNLKVEVYDNSENSETAKLLDLVYYAWNLVYCKTISKICQNLNLNFNQIYTKHNKIYNQGYNKILPNVIRPIFLPMKGPLTGHCTIPDTILFHKYFPTRLTKFILNENKRYYKETNNFKKQRQDFIRIRNKLLRKQNY